MTDDHARRVIQLIQRTLCGYTCAEPHCPGWRGVNCVNQRLTAQKLVDELNKADLLHRPAPHGNEPWEAGEAYCMSVPKPMIETREEALDREMYPEDYQEDD